LSSTATPYGEHKSSEDLVTGGLSSFAPTTHINTNSLTNLTRLSNVGSVPTDKSSNVAVVMKPGTDAEVSIVREDVLDELETEVDPHSINTKHVIVDPIAAEAYVSSLKLPFGVVDIDAQDRFALDHFAEPTLALSINRAQMSREFESMADPDYLRHSSISSHTRTIFVNWLVDVHKNSNFRHMRYSCP